MKKTLILFLLGLSLLGFMNASAADQKNGQGTKEEAKAMAEKAAEWFKKYGREKTLAEIQRGGTEKKGAFKDRDLYVFAYDFNGVCVAQGDNPKLVGQNLYNWQDADGRYNIRGHIDVASKKGSGWSPVYKWTNPETKKIEPKMTYIKKIDDTLWIGVGVYGKEAQPVDEKRIGVLMFSEQERYKESLKGIRDQLKEGGFGEEEVTLIVENADGSHVKTAELARSLAAKKLDLIITFGTNATIAVKKENIDLPVVFSVVYDPVAAGIARSLRSSGNNFTGETSRVPMSKFMSILKELAPIKKMAVVYTPGEKYTEIILNDLQMLQSSSHIKIVAIPLTKKEEVSQILNEAVHTSDAIFLTGSSVITSEAATIVEIANKARVVTVTNVDDLVGQGVLLGISPNPYQEGRLAGKKVIQIIHGAKPSSIPIESLKTFDVIINRKSAMAGQFEVPPAFGKKVTRIID